MNTGQLMRAAIFIPLMAAGAMLKVWIGPVPVTFQTVFCVMAGLLLGPKSGALAMTGYLALGLVGVPVFAGGGGIGYVMKPTFGYLVAFIPAAWVAGMLGKRKTGFGNYLSAGLSALFFIYFIGALWLNYSLIYIQNLNPTPAEILSMGVLPFVAQDLLTVTAGVLVALRIKNTGRIQIPELPGNRARRTGGD